MPEFRVGDKIRFIRDSRDGGARFGAVGDTGTVTAVNYDRSKGNFRFDDEDKQRQVGFSPNFHFEDAEIFIAPEPQSTTFYTLVYKTRHTTKRTMGFLTEREFNEKKATVLQQGGTVFGEKKLKLSNV